MMNYRQGYKKWNFTFILIIVLILLLILGTYTNFFSYMGGWAREGMSPLWRSESAWLEWIKGIHTFYTKKETLVLENEKLREENMQIRPLIAINQVLMSENKDLKTRLGRNSITENIVLASILVRPGKSLYDTIIIDVGINEGVNIGDRIITDGNVILGQIVEVGRNQSQVLLFSSPGQEVPILIGSENISAVAHGQGGNNFRIEIPRNILIEKGLPISIPGIAPYILGIVGEVNSVPQESNQEILFKTPVNIQEIKWVNVLVN